MQNISISKDVENFGSNIRQNMVKPTIIRCKPIGKLTRKWKNNFPFRKSISRYGMSISFHFQVSCRNVLSSFYLYSKFTKNDSGFHRKSSKNYVVYLPWDFPTPFVGGSELHPGAVSWLTQYTSHGSPPKSTAFSLAVSRTSSWTMPLPTITSDMVKRKETKPTPQMKTWMLPASSN